MRKALLVVALIAASFAGGAVVNGPGLKWLKEMVAGRLREPEGIPTLDVEDGAPKVEVPVASAPSASPEPPPIAAKGPAPVAADPLPIADPLPLADPAPTALAAEPLPVANPLPEKAAPSPDPGPAPAPARTAAIEPTEAPVLEPPGQARGTASPASEPDVVAAPAETAPKLGEKKATGWEDAPGPSPSVAVVPRVSGDRPRADPLVEATGTLGEVPAPASTPTPAPSATPAAGDWAAVRKRMKQLGVARYTCEGTPAGLVKFRCTVNSPGPGAAARQFEADGEDEIHAASAALRKVTVWQATEKLKGATEKR